MNIIIHVVLNTKILGIHFRFGTKFCHKSTSSLVTFGTRVGKKMCTPACFAHNILFIDYFFNVNTVNKLMIVTHSYLVVKRIH